MLGVGYGADFNLIALLDIRLVTLAEQHVYNLFGRIKTKQLTVIALFKGNTVFADQRDEIPVGVLRQRRFHKVWVLAQVVRRRDIVIGEITAATAGNQNFSTRFFSMIEQQYLTAASRRLCCAH
ncbi:hypothetical protein DA89_2128 [Vibrio paracholerae]|nr:hypothetical protein DA89_2128 [Vibrio paracholerae]